MKTISVILDCKCVAEIDASYNMIDGHIDIKDIVITSYCDKHKSPEAK